jgi:hypothetical protein
MEEIRKLYNIRNKVSKIKMKLIHNTMGKPLKSNNKLFGNLNEGNSAIEWQGELPTTTTGCLDGKALRWEKEGTRRKTDWLKAEGP